MAPWEPFYSPPLLRRPNTGSMWEPPANSDSPWRSLAGFAPPAQREIESVRPTMWEDVQRSPHCNSQAFRSSQGRMHGLPSGRAHDPRQLLADNFNADFLPRSAVQGVSVKEPGRPNMVFESRFDRFAGPVRRSRPHHIVPARPTTVADADHRDRHLLRHTIQSRDAVRQSQRFMPRRQPFADAGHAFVPHPLRTERQLCNL